jgi:type IV pilus assembly protein PilC
VRIGYLDFSYFLSHGSSLARLRERKFGCTVNELQRSSGSAKLGSDSSWWKSDISLGFLEKRPGPKDLAVMSRQMAAMIGAGLPILKTIKVLSEQTDNKILASALDAVKIDVEGGESLSGALAVHPQIFPSLMLGLVRAGEAGGFLDQSLENIASTLEKEADLRATVKSALTYPVAVLLMAFLAVIAMLIWVVPVFDQMFKSLGGQLPLPTQILVWLSPVVLWTSPVFVAAATVFLVWWRKNRQRDSLRRFKDTLVAKLPVIGKLTRKIVIARFTRNLASMLNGGVPILQALAIMSLTTQNWAMDQSLISIQNSVKSGSTLSAPMSADKVFPPMVTQMITIGEDSGTLGTMLGKVADFYDSEVKATTEQLTALIEPIMIAFIGVVIGAMIVALYLPIFTIFNEIR